MIALAQEVVQCTPKGMEITQSAQSAKIIEVKRSLDEVNGAGERFCLIFQVLHFTSFDGIHVFTQ